MAGKKGDLTIDAIMAIFLAIVTIFLLLSFFSLKMPIFAKEAYCKTFFYVASASFMPPGIRQEQSYCREFSMLEVQDVIPTKVFVKNLSDGSTSELLQFSGREQQQVEVILPENKTVTDFSFSVKGNLSNFSAQICNDPLSEWQISPMAPSRQYSSGRDVLKSAQACFSKCRAFPCPIQINITGENGNLVISDISFGYKKCLIKEEIISNILACWEKANYGKYSKDIKCKALIVRNCESSGISEQSITDYLKQQGLCRIIGNSDFGCGESDDINWSVINLKSEDSVLIEFVNSTKQIRVS